MIRRVAFALLVGGILAHPASAQSPPKLVHASPQSPPGPDLADIPPPPPRPDRPEDHAGAAGARQPARRPDTPARRTLASQGTPSTARRDSTSTPSQGQFANPGGVGRYSEYYTASTLNPQLDLRAVNRTQFGRGAAPDRSQQIAAFRAGQTRGQNIQSNINAYGRPYGAYGAGFGLGFGYGLGLSGGGGLYGGGFR